MYRVAVPGVARWLNTWHRYAMRALQLLLPTNLAPLRGARADTPMGDQSATATGLGSYFGDTAVNRMAVDSYFSHTALSA